MKKLKPVEEIKFLYWDFKGFSERLCRVFEQLHLQSDEYEQVTEISERLDSLISNYFKKLESEDDSRRD